MLLCSFVECSTAHTKLRKLYDKLIHLPVKDLLPSLYARDVVNSDQKKIAEAKVLDADKMGYILDLIIDSLKVGVPIKYNNFLEVMKESKDSVANESVKNLGMVTQINLSNNVICTLTHAVPPILTTPELPQEVTGKPVIMHCCIFNVRS